MNIKKLLVLLSLIYFIGISLAPSTTVVAQTTNSDVLFIYQNDLPAAEGYAQLLRDNDLTVEIVQLDTLGPIENYQYRSIIIGSDTGSEELLDSWGTTDAISNIVNSEIPVLGMGFGGYTLFNQLDLYEEGNIASIDQRTDLTISIYSSGILTIPNDITSNLRNYEELISGQYRGELVIDGVSNSPAVVLSELLSFYPVQYNPDPNVPFSVVDPSLQLAHFSEQENPDNLVTGDVISDVDGTFIRWGFTGDIQTLSSVGQELFVNVVYYTLSQNLNCAISPYALQDQRRFRFARFTGDEATEKPDPEMTVENWTDLTPYTSWGVNPSNPFVSIVIVDDFSYPNPESSHGAYILNLFEQMAQSSGLAFESQQEFTERGGWPSILYSNDSVYLRFILIDVATLEYNTRRIGAAIVNYSVGSFEFVASKSIINMSFAMVPEEDPETGFQCSEFVEWRESLLEVDPKGPAYTLTIEDYFPLILNESESEAVELLTGEDLAFDTLRYFMNTLVTASRLSSAEPNYIVAAAGNFGDTIQQSFFPAEVPEIISVSSNSGSAPEIQFNPNAGEVVLPGGWYYFDLPGDEPNYQIGTSFSAPVMSMLLALDLSQENPRCLLRTDVRETPANANLSIAEWFVQNCPAP